MDETADQEVLTCPLPIRDNWRAEERAIRDSIFVNVNRLGPPETTERTVGMMCNI